MPDYLEGNEGRRGEYKANVLRSRRPRCATRSFSTTVVMINSAAWQAGTWNILELPSAQFTAMVNCGAVLYSPASGRSQMTRSAKRKEKSVSGESSSVRATISFPPEIYQTLEDIARQKKVSLAWVVREASEQYIADKWPLLAPRKGA